MEIHQAGDTVYIQLNTHQADGTPITWAGSPAVAVVKDGGTTTETDGVSLTVDAGSVTGRHIITIDTSQDGTFFATGHKFSVIVTAGTVDSVSTVGVIVAEFELGEVPADVQAWDGGTVPTPAEAGDAMTLTEAYDAAKAAAPVGAAMTLTGAYDAAKTAAPSAATVAGAVLDEALGEHDGWLTLLLTAAGYTAPANSDIATLLSRLTATRAGYLDNLTNLDASISSRLATSGYTAPDNASIALILADTGELQTNQSNWLTADLSTLESRLSAARAGYLDLLNTYLDAAVSGVVAPTVDEINTKLETEHGAGSWGAQGAYTITPTTPLTDSVSGDPISGMTVKIYSNALRTETYLITEVTSDTEGSFTAHVTAPGTYYLRAIKEGYTTLEWTEVAA